MKKKAQFVKNQKGQGVLEYVLLTGLIGIFCLVAIKKIGSSLNSEMGKINTKINGIVQAQK